MSVDALIKLWEKGGVALVVIAMLFLLAWFVGRRGVKAMDRMATAQTDSMTTIANAVQVSSAAQVVALGGLTERVSRMEGKVDTLGAIAVGHGPHGPHHATPRAVATVAQVFDENEHTPIGPIPVPFEPQSHPQLTSIPKIKRAQTPAGGYSIPRPTKGGKP